MKQLLLWSPIIAFYAVPLYLLIYSILGIIRKRKQSQQNLRIELWQRRAR